MNERIQDSSSRDELRDRQETQSSRSPLLSRTAGAVALVGVLAGSAGGGAAIYESGKESPVRSQNQEEQLDINMSANRLEAELANNQPVEVVIGLSATVTGSTETEEFRVPFKDTYHNLVYHEGELFGLTPDGEDAGTAADIHPLDEAFPAIENVSFHDGSSTGLTIETAAIHSYSAEQSLNRAPLPEEDYTTNTDEPEQSKKNVREQPEPQEEPKRHYVALQAVPVDGGSPIEIHRPGHDTPKTHDHDTSSIGKYEVVRLVEELKFGAPVTGQAYEMKTE